MGLFPNTRQDFYLITVPRYKKVIIQAGKGEFTIVTTNIGRNNIYSFCKVLNRLWIKHQETWMVECWFSG